MNDVLPEWDVQVVNRMVRDRLYLAQDTVKSLMGEESKLILLCGGESHEAIDDLAKRAQQVKALGGDASALLSAHSAALEAMEEHLPRLLEVQDHLQAARQNCKWLDMAQSGLHFACFTDPRFQEVLDGGKS